jgi:hypothetical protein
VYLALRLLMLQNRNSSVNAQTMPVAAKASELPNPVGYFGFSLSMKMKDPAMPPQLPWWLESC